jgi:hypothetical protein
MKWDTYLAPFSRSLWLTLLLLALFTALILHALCCFSRRRGVVEATLLHFRFSDCLFYIISAFCQQGAYLCSCFSRAVSASIPDRFPAIHHSTSKRGVDKQFDQSGTEIRLKIRIVSSTGSEIVNKI